MLHLFYGNDRNAIAKKTTALVAQYQVQGYTPMRLALLDASDEGMIIEELLGVDMFTPKKIYIVDDVLAEEKIFEIIKNWDMNVSAEKHLIVRESAVPLARVKEIEKIGGKVEKYVLAEKKDADIFQLTDAWASRDTKRAWLTFHALLDKGMVVHQMIAMLWWQIRTLLLVSVSKENPGLKPFVYAKSKKALERFTKKELSDAAMKLLAVYHDGHRGDDIEVLFEKFILG
jgi:DNA polymerase III delta subunit